MENQEIGWIAAIIIGGIAGWLAEQFMQSRTGVLMNILLGIVGAAIASWLFSLLGVTFAGWIGYLIAGFIGACVLIFVGRAIRRPAWLTDLPLKLRRTAISAPRQAIRTTWMCSTASEGSAESFAAAARRKTGPGCGR
jgi:uncharacterized membrane protein YeaQ/YmgE (transglycosylase-associated protein family)